MSIAICADSTCDLSPALIGENEITITPLSVVIEGTRYLDGVEITPDDIFARAEGGGAVGSTAAVNVSEYIRAFSRLLESHDDVLHFTISGEMSSCYQNACVAAAQCGHVFVVDSRSLSTGIGHLVLDAARMAREGMAAADIQRQLEERRQRLDVSFVLDTLAYLHRGGRCSAIAAMGANLLHLKPCIEVKNGAMGVGKKYRGSLDGCLERYVREKLADPSSIDSSRLFITHSGLAPARVAAVEQTIRACMEFDHIYHTRAGCTVSNHCGPGCLGILFYRKEQAKS